MPASYPTSVKAFTTRSNGQTIDAAHVNDLQLEVTAIETDLIAGLPVARGGTGNTSITANRIPYGNGTSALQTSASLTFDGSTFTTAAISATTGTFSGTVTPQGLVDASGASAGQFKFPGTQNASADVNTLDDYEEGTWTPAIGGSGGQSGQVYTTQVGSYIKIGKLVHASFVVTLSTLGTVTTSAQVQGLPFTSQNTSNMTASMVVGSWSGLTTALVQLSGTLAANSTAITLLGAGAAATSMSNLVQGDLSNTTSITGSIVYRASA